MIHGFDFKILYITTYYIEQAQVIFHHSKWMKCPVSITTLNKQCDFFFSESNARHTSDKFLLT